MNFPILRNTILAAVLSIFAFGARAAEVTIPAAPDSACHVCDFAGILGTQAKVMEDSLTSLQKSCKAVVMVVTVSDLGDYDPNMFASQLIDKWGIGQKGADNGMVILLKPKTNDSKGQVYIGTGRGMEGAFPDAFCKRITSEQMIPCLKKNNDYTAATWAALKVIMPVCRGEYSQEQYNKDNKKKDESSNIVLWLFGGGFVAFIIFIWRRIKKQKAAGWVDNSATSKSASKASGVAGAAAAGAVAAKAAKTETLEERREREEKEREEKEREERRRREREERQRRERERRETFGGGTSGGGGAGDSW